jgi:hypothetical protein
MVVEELRESIERLWGSIKDPEIVVCCDYAAATLGTLHGDGRLKLIERLAAAYRAGELPDCMLELVDSLRTQTTRTTS